MGVSLNVVFDKKVPPYGTLTDDHNALGDGLGRLDKALRRAGLTGLGGFVSMDPSDWVDMDEDDPHAAGVPPMRWFEAGEGLAVVQATIAHLREKPKAISWSADALEELGSIEAALAAAVKKKAKFRFAICD